MNKAIKVLQKHAGLFSKKPKWLTDPNWKEDEDAVNDWYSTWTGTGGSPKYLHDANKRALEMSSDEEILDLARKYNLNYRKKRVDDKTAYYLDKLQELGIISPAYHDYLLKQDRDDALATADFEYTNAVEENPEYEKIFKNFDWDKDYTDEEFEALEKTPYGEELERLYKDIYNYRPGKDAPMTRKDTGSIEDATPYQIEKWKRKANQSALLAGLKGALKTGLTTGGIGAGLGFLGGGKTRYDSDVSNDEAWNNALGGAAVMGGLGTLAGGVYGGIRDAIKTIKEKRNAKYRLNEKPIGKEAAYKHAGLDNYWMSLNPETNKYEDAPLEGIKSDNYGSIDPYWFRGKAYGDLVDAISTGDLSLYGMSPIPREWYDDDEEYEMAKEYDGDAYNWLTNKQCRQIYKKLRKLSPRKLRKLRKRFDGIYYIPEDEDVQAFVDQFKKHTDAGHSLLASW